ncbi:PEX5-related protein [Cynoglossus semilaevis]|uniref:PEX5-related protein n=1 Tax=Cynoglossus semilaevis TaxID=244447 RepID=UPI0007DCA6B7|nr:PEX5-related protein-like [Cynoglossus semilaevis]
MYQVQGKGERVVAMVLKELPGKKTSGEGHALLAVTTKQESRPLLSPSIDDFLSETRGDAPPTLSRPLTSNTAVLSTTLDLVDLSEPSDTSGRSHKDHRWSPTKRSPSEDTGLNHMEAGHVDSGGLNQWHVDIGVGRRRTLEKKCSSHHSSSELLWSVDFKTDPLMKNFDVHDDLDLLTSSKESRPTRRRTRSLLTRNESLEDEFFRAKAAVESDTVFWDKMQAEWEELVRRKWLDSDCEDQQPVQTMVSPAERGYLFSPNNPYRDQPNAFLEGQERGRQGDLTAAVLLLEAAIFQDPQDYEAWQLLGSTQAENENERAAIVSLQRCLELRPDHLPALLALAVSCTNCGLQQEACDALWRWISHNPRYKHLVELQGSPSSSRSPRTFSPLRTGFQEVLHIFQEASQENLDCVDPDLQTGLGVLFNLSADFNKAVSAFTTALSVRPQDYLLWNRLGATLANGNRSEEAVEAYTRALELQPGFIRSRYNLGISCINLGAHREAVSNFLTALNQQRRSQRCSQQQMSSNIWAALRVAVSLMDRPDLVQAANAGDLDLLMLVLDRGDI